MSHPLILASASPRRREMLARVGVALEVLPANVDETPRAGEPPDAYVARIAHTKATSITPGPGRWVLAADTTVTLDGAIFGKAETPEEAAAMLRALSGKTHQVHTAFVLATFRGGERIVHHDVVTTEVEMVELDDEMIDDYVASEEWRGKAGAYALQGIAAALVREVRGSVTNVVGLPLAEVLAALRAAGAPGPNFAAGSPA